MRRKLTRQDSIVDNSHNTGHDWTTASNGHLVSDWRVLSGCMGLNEIDIEAIAYRYEGARERCYHSLMRWTDIADATGLRIGVAALLQVLRHSNCHKLAGITHRRLFSPV